MFAFQTVFMVDFFLTALTCEKKRRELDKRVFLGAKYIHSVAANPLLHVLCSSL